MKDSHDSIPAGAEGKPPEEIAATLSGTTTEISFQQSLIAGHASSLFGDRIMYVGNLGWHLYTHGRWWNAGEVTDDRVRGLVIEAARDLIFQSATLPTKEERETAFDAASRALSSAGYLNGVLVYLRADSKVSRTHLDLNPDPWLLNLADCTLDLRTMSPKRHDPADRITKIARASFDPDARGETWEWLLANAFPSEPVRRAFLRVMGGLGLPGITRGEHALPIFQGRSGTGKSSTAHAIMHATGDYSIKMDKSVLLMKANSGAHSTPVVDLLGARLAFAIETDEGVRWATATVKELTGGDAIRARRLYKDNIEWDPTHQIVMMTNYLPAIPDASDDAVWRRVKVFPVDHVLTDVPKDFWLKLEMEADAVMASLLAGYRDYEENGISWPEEVNLLTNRYRENSDVVVAFLNDTYVRAEEWMKVRDVYIDYTHWIVALGDRTIKPGRIQDFTDSLTRRGWTIRYDHKARAQMIWGLARKAAPA